MCVNEFGKRIIDIVNLYKFVNLVQIIDIVKQMEMLVMAITI